MSQSHDEDESEELSHTGKSEPVWLWLSSRRVAGTADGDQVRLTLRGRRLRHEKIPMSSGMA